MNQVEGICHNLAATLRGCLGDDRSGRGGVAVAACHYVCVEPAEGVVDQQCVGDVPARRADIDRYLVDVEGSNLVECAVECFVGRHRARVVRGGLNADCAFDVDRCRVVGRATNFD